MNGHLAVFTPEQHEQAQQAITAASAFLAAFVAQRPNDDHVVVAYARDSGPHLNGRLAVEDLHRLIHLADMRRTLELVERLNRLHPIMPGTLFTLTGDHEAETIAGLTEALHMLAGHTQMAVIASRPASAFAQLTEEEARALNHAGWFRKPF